jgi:hypothetical protein
MAVQGHSVGDEPMEETKKVAQNKQEDAALNRILLWFGGAVVTEAFMLFIRRFYLNYTVKEIIFAYELEKVIHMLIYVGAVGFVVCLLWTLAAAKIHKPTGLPHILTVVFALMGICCAVTWWYQASGVHLLCALIPAVTVLALIYHLYQRECFLSIALTSAGILGLWIFRRANGGHRVVVYSYLTALAVLLIVVTLLTLFLQKRGGQVVWHKRQVPIFSKSAAYTPVYVTCGMVAAVLIAGVTAGMAVAYYLMFGLLAWVFILAVYFTVKLM